MLRLAAAALACLLLVGCEKAATHESVMEEQLSTMEEMTNTMKTIVDEKTAEAAKPKLVEIGNRMKALQTKDDKLDKLPRDKQDELRKKFDARMSAVMQAMMTEGGRLEADPKLKDVMKDVGTATTATN